MKIEVRYKRLQTVAQYCNAESEVRVELEVPDETAKDELAAIISSARAELRKQVEDEIDEAQKLETERRQRAEEEARKWYQKRCEDEEEEQGEEGDEGDEVPF